MAEPQPPTVQEGSSEIEHPTPLPANAEDRKAAAALDSLDREETSTAPKKEVDTKALGEALKNLELASGSGANKPGAQAAKKEQEAPKKIVKVDAADVNLLVDQLDLSKPKATELLRAHDADALKAMKAWVSAAV